jgi:hypothetical protein
LLKRYNKVWVFGDSYTTSNYCVDAKESFWGLLAKHLNCATITNASWPGNSLESVLHNVVGLSPQYDWEHDFLVIGIPPLIRLTVFDNYKNTEYLTDTFNTTNWQNTQESLECHRGLANLKIMNVKDLAMYEDRGWTETHALREIFLLTQWLDFKNASYLIVNLSKPFDTNNIWGPSEVVLPYAKSHNKCILFDNTYYSSNLDKHKPADFDQHGWMGHHGPAGNKNFFELSVKDKLC